MKERKIQHGEYRYSVGNTVSNTRVTMCGVKGALDLRGEPFVRSTNA